MVAPVLRLPNLETSYSYKQETIKFKKMDLLLSPHADDIAFSVGGALLQGYMSKATLVTVFEHSSYIPYADPTVSVEQASAIRHAEDLAYADKLGLRHMGLGLKDTTQRGYLDLEEIFTVTDYRKDPSAVQIIQTIQSFLNQHTEITRLWVPLAIGNHIDHLLVLNSVLTWKADPKPELIFYEDIPYAGCETLQNIQTQVYQSIGFLEVETIDLGDRLEEKLTNLKIYASQVSQEDIDLAKLHAQRIVPGLAVERVWRKLLHI